MSVQKRFKLAFKFNGAAHPFGTAFCDEIPLPGDTIQHGDACYQVRGRHWKVDQYDNYPVMEVVALILKEV